MVGLELLHNWTLVFFPLSFAARHDLTSNLSVHAKSENTVRRNMILADQNVFYI